MGATASQITSLDCWLNRLFKRRSPHKWPVTRKMFPFEDVIMGLSSTELDHVQRIDILWHRQGWCWARPINVLAVAQPMVNTRCEFPVYTYLVFLSRSRTLEMVNYKGMILSVCVSDLFITSEAMPISTSASIYSNVLSTHDSLLWQLIIESLSFFFFKYLYFIHLSGYSSHDWYCMVFCTVTNIGSDNGVSAVRRCAIIWTIVHMFYELTRFPQCRIYAAVIQVSIGSDNGLSPIQRQSII